MMSASPHTTTTTTTTMMVVCESSLEDEPPTDAGLGVDATSLETAENAVKCVVEQVSFPVLEVKSSVVTPAVDHRPKLES
mmetsp:Transcript_76051/g.88433  ORF Transcript_76051/g.88433 Transcript_76051/m.88433 type:complete len:80 (+) Transcript_76051:70-309(+)